MWTRRQTIFCTVQRQCIKYQTTMLTTTKVAKHLCGIVLGIIIVSFSKIPTHAQSRTSESFNFDELSIGDERDWNFSSEDEKVSIQDDLKELREYDISGTEYFDVRLIDERRRRLGIKGWGNRGYRSIYSVGDGLYPYFFRENRIYNRY